MASSERERRERPAGPATAATIVLAADLAALTARVAGDEDLVERARALAAQAEELARADEEAYAELLAGGGPEVRERTVELPARMAELAAEAAELAAAAAERGRGPARYDAAAGALLAEAAARAACLLVRVNLAGAVDPRLGQAREGVARARAAAARAAQA